MHNSWCFGSAIFVLLTGCQVCWSQDFGYNGEKGPSHWGEQYNECTGKHQSPINIDLLSVKRVVLPSLKMTGFDVPPDRTTLKNNGHTVMITIESQIKPTISGGPLDGDYEFAQFHFHWGDNDTFGSEDLIDGRSFPMELHMVFFNKRYESFKQANHHPDGLCVLAFFYDLHDKDNKNYEEFSEILSQVVHPESNATFNQPISLYELMSEDLVHYFTYNGSLTTPPCSEIVTWIDFQEPIMLSHRQIQMFRDLLDEDGHILTHNFRPIQPLGDRIVLFNLKDLDDNTLHMTDSPNNNIPPEVDSGITFDRTDSPKDEIPPEVDSGTNDDLSGGDKNVLNDSPDNNLDDATVNKKVGKKSKLDSGSSTQCLPWYLLSMTIVIFILSDRRMF